MKEETMKVKREEVMTEAGVPAAPQTPEPGPTPQAPTKTRAVFVEFRDGDLRVYRADSFKLDRDALSMVTATGPVAIPADLVREAKLQVVMVDQAGNIQEPRP